MISLGGALLGLPAADGHSLPDEGVPEPWLLLFVEQYADAGVYAGLFSASKAGQAWALRTSPKAQCVLDATAPTPADVWAARLDRVCDALITRGALPTALKVVCGVYKCCEDQMDTERCQAIAAVLAGHAAGVTDLHVSGCKRVPISPELTAFYHGIPAVFPSLRCLTLMPCPTPLPPPTGFPQLRELHVSLDLADRMLNEHQSGEVVDACLVSIAPYLPQLTAITVDSHGDAGFEWPALFTGVPEWPRKLRPCSTTLTTFSTTESLTDELCRLLRHCTPSLRRLRVDRLDLNQDHSHREWGVRFLSLQYSYMPSDLLHLPTCASGAVYVSARQCDLCIDTSEVSRLTIVTRCSEWCTDYTKRNEVSEVMSAQECGKRTRDTHTCRCTYSVHTAMLVTTYLCLRYVVRLSLCPAGCRSRNPESVRRLEVQHAETDCAAVSARRSRPSRCLPGHRAAARRGAAGAAGVL